MYMHVVQLSYRQVRFAADADPHIYVCMYSIPTSHRNAVLMLGADVHVNKKKYI